MMHFILVVLLLGFSLILRDFFPKNMLLVIIGLLGIGKWVKKINVSYILLQCSCTNYIEGIRFFKNKLKKDFETITSQAIGKQRAYIDPKLYIDMSEEFID